jgi:hypothetical protein
MLSNSRPPQKHKHQGICSASGVRRFPVFPAAGPPSTIDVLVLWTISLTIQDPRTILQGAIDSHGGSIGTNTATETQTRPGGKHNRPGAQETQQKPGPASGLHPVPRFVSGGPRDTPGPRALIITPGQGLGWQSANAHPMTRF